MLYHIVSKIIFQFDPEKIHNIFFQKLKKINNSSFKFLIRQTVAVKPVYCMGLYFKNPIGLAAGLDKDGEYIDVLGAMGFGFIEVGTVTPKPQYGNDKPRLFRIIKANALINRMGFNNKGVDNLIENIKKSSYNGIIGVNIGKNKNTLIEYCIDDYLFCMNKVYPYAGYIVINISSPNTHELYKLQHDSFLDDFLKKIRVEQLKLQLYYKKHVPVLVKISPDLTENEIVRFVDSILKQDIDGVVATNTTLDRSLVQGLSNYNETGGLSGRPLQLKSTQVIKIISKELNGKKIIIGTGGVDSLISAREKINAGASLIQIYSGLIYYGPKLIKSIINYI